MVVRCDSEPDLRRLPGGRALIGRRRGWPVTAPAASEMGVPTPSGRPPTRKAAAQRVYNEWDQSHPDGDPELGFGGICENIADEIGNVVQSLGFDTGTMSAQCGEQHIWAIAYTEIPTLFGTEYEGYHIDISPSIYESGYSYVWRKKKGVVFDANHVSITPIDADQLESYLQYGE